MIELKGKYNTAKVFTNNIEKTAISQITTLLDQEAFKDSKVRIMPDVHAGKGCTIGFTANLGDKVIPNLVGVDIGCGMLTIDLGNIDIDLEKLDKVINAKIPSGFNKRQKAIADFTPISNLKCLSQISNSNWNQEKWECQLGTLGGGNHFIEVSEDSKGNKYLIIHTGSRNLGNRIAKHYQDLAEVYCKPDMEGYNQSVVEMVLSLSEIGRSDLIESSIVDLKKECFKNQVPLDLSFLEGDAAKDYLFDMRIAQEFALKNRDVIGGIIIEEMRWKYSAFFHTVHNYIDFQNDIVRKGAVSAKEGELLLIPVNMRDGSLLCVGKGNPDWNYSAPHGAGRLMSRSQAKKKLSLKDFEEEMKDVYSTSVVKSTLDEAPMAYKSMQEIKDNIIDTVNVIEVLKPIYNYKAH